MRKRILLIWVIVSLSLFAQHRDNEGHTHGDSNYELGVSLGVSKLIDENETAPSVHLHLMRKVVSQSTLGGISIGLGFEYLFSEHLHYSVVGTISLNPYSSFIFDVSPGVLVTKHEAEKEQQFVTHIELTYEFDYLGIGFGPVIGYGFAKEDKHFSVGIHLGIGL